MYIVYDYIFMSHHKYDLDLIQLTCDKRTIPNYNRFKNKIDSSFFDKCLRTKPTGHVNIR